MLNTLSSYTSKWKLNVNTEKTKIVVFRKGGKLKNCYTWCYDNVPLDVVDNFNYLGITFNFNGKFNKAQSILAMQCKKSMNILLSKMRSLHLNVSTKLNLFDTYVSCIALYSCEVWGAIPAKSLESVHLNFCKKILGVKKSAASMMIYSELGRLPLEIERTCRMVKYFFKLRNTENCILRNIYSEMYTQCLTEPNSKCWLSSIRDTLFSVGLGYVWSEGYGNEKVVLLQLRQRLKDIFIQNMFSFFNSSSKCRIYKYICHGLDLQPYLTKPIPDQYKECISKFRLSCHMLEIERGRYFNIPECNRKCKLCSNIDIEDEYHFIFICPVYENLRKLYIDKYYYEKPSMYKLLQLFSNTNTSVICNFGKFLYKASKLKLEATT
jgi:hypothetical protein